MAATMSNAEVKVLDMRGKSGFPTDCTGLCFEITVTTTAGKSADRYVVRTDTTFKGWRIDSIDLFGLNSAVYGPNSRAYWPDAAEAIAVVLDIHGGRELG